MDAADKARILATIAKEVSACPDCGLHVGTTHHVPGEGNADADIVFIGEGPGFYEDRQGRPFVGAAGKFLDELLGSIGMDRSTVYITNVVKCRPPNNRDPQPAEIEACRRHLERQLETIGPRVVVTLGRHSMQRYFPGEAISRIHGQPRRKADLIVVPMYHPAAALHQQALRKVIEADFRKLPEFLARTIGGADPAVPAHLRRGAPERGATTAPAPVTPPEASDGKEEPQQMRLL
jgi:DNA polymerase